MRKGIGLVSVYALVVMVCLSACGKNNNTSNGSGVKIIKLGELRFSQMSGLGVNKSFKSLSSSSTNTMTFDLGTIKASRDFYFLLTNSGDVPVTDVVITSSNGNFAVSPQKFDSIEPQRDAFVTPVVRVSVLHGIALDGTGFSNSLLPMGNNTCTLTITGKTTDQNNNIIDVNVEVTLSVMAEVMDISITDSTQAIDLLHPDQMYGTNLATAQFPEYFCVNPVLQNTGNVDINFTSYYWATSGWTVLEQFTLHPNEIITFQFPSSVVMVIVMKMESNNTITNYNRLRLQVDGSVWIALGKI